MDMNSLSKSTPFVIIDAVMDVAWCKLGFRQSVVPQKYLLSIWFSNRVPGVAGVSEFEAGVTKGKIHAGLE
jgi:hypothetical protein